MVSPSKKKKPVRRRKPSMHRSKLPKPKGPRMVTVGIDPGWAKTGVAVLVKTEGEKPRIALLRLIKTEPGGIQTQKPKPQPLPFSALINPPKKKKRKRKLPKGTRVSDDDLRRMREVWTALLETFDEWRPAGIAVEHYAPWAGSMGGNAWKTALGYQLAICAAFTVGWGPVVKITRPDDLKRAFLGKTKGTKVQTIKAMHQKVLGLEEALDDFNEGDHEHVVDAVGHAYLALVERQEA